LVGTDIISRGIDVVGIELVINFDTPNDPEDYVHRVGRTARADSKGEAITFVNDKDKFKFNSIEKLIGMEIDKIPLPEGFESGPSYSSSSSSNSRGDFKKGKKTSSSGSGNRQSNHPKSDHKPQRKPRENSSQPHVVRDPENPDTPSGFKPRQNPKVEKNPEFQEKPKESKFGSRKNVID
jgi:superfamily II DNA/RNA helicase